jgi:ribonuclease P protein component
MRGNSFASGAHLRYRFAMQPVLTVMTRRADFLAANKGLRVARPGFVLLARPNGGLGTRFGITVTKKIGNAVVRNRMKRRFRALIREILPVQGLADHDHVLIGRDGGVERDFTLLRVELSAALERAVAGKGDPPRGTRGKGRPRPGKGPGKGPVKDSAKPGNAAPRQHQEQPG